MERLTDELISIGFEVELIVTPIMARLRHPDSGIGALEDDDGISTPTYFHSTLPIQEEYRPDHRFLEVVERFLKHLPLPVERPLYPGEGAMQENRGWTVHGDPSLRPLSPEQGKMFHST